MSKRCELQKSYFQQKGNYKGNGKYSDEYVKWLEDKVLAQEQVKKCALADVEVEAKEARVNHQTN